MRWRIKSPASRLFSQSLIQAQIKENIKYPCHWPLCREFTGDRWIPRTMASKAENVSIWWSCRIEIQIVYCIVLYERLQQAHTVCRDMNAQRTLKFNKTYQNPIWRWTIYLERVHDIHAFTQLTYYTVLPYIESNNCLHLNMDGLIWLYIGLKHVLKQQIWYILVNIYLSSISGNDHTACYQLVTGEFPSQRPVTQSFDVFFVLNLNKRLSKQSSGWWFETQSCSYGVIVVAKGNDYVTVGHRRRVTAVTRLPRWRRRKTRLQARPLLTMLQGMDRLLQGMDRCDFWHASRYWMGLTCDTVIFGHHESEWPSGALVFSGGRRVT